MIQVLGLKCSTIKKGEASPFRIDIRHNRSAFFLCMAVFLTGLSASSAAPRSHQKEADWYTNPCGRPPLLRHGRSTAEDQLKYFVKRIDYFYRNLGMLYKNGTHDHQPTRNKCLKVNSYLRSIQEASNSTEAMQMFYKSMIQIARLIEKLKEIPVKTYAKFNLNLRKKIYEETKGNLRLVICEFNDTLSKFDEKLLSHSLHIFKLNTKCLPSSLDMSKAQMMDYDFYRKLKKFFKQSRKLLRQKKNRSKKLKKANRLGNKKRTKQQKIVQ